MKNQKMKIKTLLLAAFLAFALVSCATNRAQKDEAAQKTIFDYAYNGVLSSYKDYFGKEPEYEVHGPRETDELDKKHGWSEYCYVTCGADETVYRIKYVKNRSWAISTVEISKPTDDLFLGKYIGKPKSDVLLDFPDGADDKGFVIFYESEDFLISFSIKGGIVSYIHILTKDKKAENDSSLPAPDDNGEIQHSPLIAKDITLDGTNWIKTQFCDERTGEPLANRRFIIYVLQGDEISEIYTKTDENGWIYLTNLPDGEYYTNILDSE